MWATREDAGARTGTSSSCLKTQSAGREERVIEMLVRVSLKSSKFAGAALLPKGVDMSKKNLPSQVSPKQGRSESWQ